jgi:hypothetical protein
MSPTQVACQRVERDPAPLARGRPALGDDLRVRRRGRLIPSKRSNETKRGRPRVVDRVRHA